MRNVSVWMKAWSVAGICFLGAAIAIYIAKPAYHARARAEISKTEASAEGLGSFQRLDFGAMRTMPVNLVAQMSSLGTTRRALHSLHLPEDDRAVADAAKSMTARLMPGTTIVEVIARAPDPRKAESMVTALVAAGNSVYREQRIRLADAAVASLEVASKRLQAETVDVAAKLAALDVRRPIEYATYSAKMETTVLDTISKRAALEAALKRLESTGTGDIDAMVGSLDDMPSAKAEENEFAKNVGYVALRSSIIDKLSRLANLRASYGPNNNKVRQAESDLHALETSLREYVRGQITQLRAQIAAMDHALDDFNTRIRTRDDVLKALHNTELSPEFATLSLRRDLIVAQLKEIESRRGEILAYKDLDQPVLTVFDPPHVSRAPEYQLRGSRLVFSGFGALLVGFSLGIILTHREVI
jgi:hypothetical protein